MKYMGDRKIRLSLFLVENLSMHPKMIYDKHY